MAEENFKLTKTLYSIKSTDGLIDRSFSEFFKTKDPINLDRFFSIYGELFYDIPKTGTKSHTSIIKQSTDYIKNYIDPRDEQITLLTERIAELEELLNQPTEEHPFFANGSLIGLDESVNEDGTIGNGLPDDYKIYYMDKGKRRYVVGGAPGPVFQALKASLGFPNNFTDDDIVKIVPRVVLEGITEGSQLDIEDVTGQTAAQQLESQLEIVSDIQVSSWRAELSDLVKPIEDGTIGGKIDYIALLKAKIKSEFQREGELESLTWKYYLDATQGFTQEEKDNGEKLLALVRPKIIRSRQTLVILKRIWDRKDDFPNIMFDDFLPSTAAVNSDGAIVDDKGSGTQMYPILESQMDQLGGWDEGRDIFDGVLSGADYSVSFNASELEYKNPDAISLLDRNLIRIRYNRYILSGSNSNVWYDPDTNEFQGIKEGQFRKKHSHYGTDISRDEYFSIPDSSNRFKFAGYAKTGIFGL